MEIKNKLSGPEGRKDGDNGGKKGNMYKGPTEKDNGVGTVFGSGSWMG